MKFILFFILNQNLLINPSFEEWIGDSIWGWKIAHPFALPVLKEEDTVYHGNFSIKIKRQSATTTLTDALISDTVSITGGTYYYIGAYIFDNDTNIYAKVQVNWYKNGIYLTYGITSSSQNINGWQLLYAQKLAPDTANQAIIKIKIYPVDTLQRTGSYFCDYAFLSIEFKINEGKETIFSKKNIKELKGYKIFNISGQKTQIDKNGVYFIKIGNEIKKFVIF